MSARVRVVFATLLCVLVGLDSVRAQTPSPEAPPRVSPEVVRAFEALAVQDGGRAKPLRAVAGRRRHVLTHLIPRPAWFWCNVIRSHSVSTERLHRQP